MRKTAFWIVGFVLGLSAGCDSGPSEAELMEQARTAYDQGQWPRAIVNLKNALRQNQGNPEARLLLGRVYLQSGQAEGAEKELRRALEFGVAAEGVMPLLAQALLRQDKYKELQALDTDLLHSPAEKARVLAYQAWGSLLAGQRSAAAERLKQARVLAPALPLVRLVSARALSAEGRDEEALRQLRQLAAQEKDNAEVWAAIGEMELKAGRLKEALEAFRQAVETAADTPSRSAYQLKAAAVNLQLGKVARAREQVDKLVQALPRNAAVQYLKGRIDLVEGKLDEAKAALEQVVKAKPDHLRANYYLAVIHLRQGNLDVAREYAKRAMKQSPNSVGVRLLMGAVQVAQGKGAAAQEVISPVVTQFGDNATALDLMANALLLQGRPAEAVVYLEKLADVLPKRGPETKLRILAALLAAGKEHRAVDVAEELSDMASSRPPIAKAAYELLIDFYLRRSDLAAVKKYVDRYAQTWPKDVKSSLYTALIQARGQDRPAAIAVLQEILARQPENLTAKRLIAELMIRENRLNEAEAQLQDIVQRKPGDVFALMMKANIAMIRGNRAEVEKDLQAAVESAPASLVPRLALARYYLDLGRADEVPGLFVELGAREQKNPAVLRLKFEAALARGRYAEARSIFKEIEERIPADPTIDELKARLLAGQGDLSEAVSLLDRVLDRSPENYRARMAKARMLVAEGRIPQARREVELLERQVGDNADVLRLKSALALLQRDRGVLEAAKQRLFESSPNRITLLELVQAKWAVGKTDEAMRLLEKWLQGHPNDTQVVVMLAVAHAKRGDPDAAIREYKRALRLNSDNLVALNNLAELVRDREPAQAVDYAKRALELAPDSAEVMDTLGMAYLGTGELAKAERMLSRALQREGDNPELLFHQALIEQAQGKTSAALARLDEALSRGRDFEERERAEKVRARLRALKQD